MKVYKSGTEIQFKTTKQKGIIISAVVRQKDVVYNVDYFVGEEMKDCVVYEFQFDVIKNNGKQIIGFK
jgi:hypothetical protein